MVGVEAAFGIMGVFFVGAPAGLVLEHVECEHFNVLVHLVQVSVQIALLEQAVRDVVIFDAYWFSNLESRYTMHGAY